MKLSKDHPILFLLKLRVVAYYFDIQAYFRNFSDRNLPVLINSEPVFCYLSFGMPATARSVLRAIVCAGRSRNDSESSGDDDRLDLLGDEDVLGDGLQWHLHEEEQTGGSISGIEGLLVTPGGSAGPQASDEETGSPSPGGISDPQGGSSDDEMALPLTPGGVEGPQGSDVTPGGTEYPQGGDEPMNDSYHSDDAMLGELGTGPVTPGGPYRPQGCVGVEAIPFSCG